jgi:hypothetical protein
VSTARRSGVGTQPRDAAADTGVMKIGAATPARPLSRPASASAPRPGARSFLEVLGETRAANDAAARPPAPAAAPGAAAPSRTSPSSAPSPLARGLARALDSVTAGGARVDAILDAAARGKTFSASEMLAMQATVFRYSQTVEVLSRATDRLVGAIKQTLGTPV